MEIASNCVASAIEDALGLVQAAAREQQLSHPLTVSASLLDRVEIAMVGDQRFVSFFVGPVAHYIVPVSAALFLSRCAIRPLRQYPIEAT